MSIQLEHITKRYGKVLAANDINLEIPEGRFLSIVGPSGCGKTTLLRVLAGFTQPTSGLVRIHGQVVNDVPPRSRGIGMVFQHYALFPNLTVYENVAFGLRARRTPQPEVDRRVKELIRLVHMEGKEGSLPRELSGGQQQRVAVARALAVEPKVLLLDEPLSALDAKVRLELRYELKRIQQEAGITAVYVTHDQEEALSISDNVAVMNEGKIEQVGTPEDVYARPQTRFVAQFVGISNIFDAEVVSPPEGLVRWKDHIIKTMPFTTGSREVLVMVRPERMRIVREDDRVPDASEYGETILSGRVLGQVFLGSTIRLAISVDDSRIFADVQNIEDARFSFGDELTLAFERSAAHVIE